MWRSVASSQLKSLASWRYQLIKLNPSLTSATSSSSSPTTPFQKTATLFSHQAISDADNILSKGKKKKRVEDVMPIATGHEREELEAGLEGRNILKMNYPVGPFGTKVCPFGTKEAPAIVKSVYDKRIFGCPGGEGEDEHDVVWFWLEKGKPHECPVCSQYFMLKVVGPGGPPDGHGDDGHH